MRQQHLWKHDRTDWAWRTGLVCMRCEDIDLGESDHGERGEPAHKCPLCSAGREVGMLLPSAGRRRAYRCVACGDVYRFIPNVGKIPSLKSGLVRVGDSEFAERSLLGPAEGWVSGSVGDKKEPCPSCQGTLRKVMVTQGECGYGDCYTALFCVGCLHFKPLVDGKRYHVSGQRFGRWRGTVDPSGSFCPQCGNEMTRIRMGAGGDASPCRSPVTEPQGRNGPAPGCRRAAAPAASCALPGASPDGVGVLKRGQRRPHRSFWLANHAGQLRSGRQAVGDGE